MEKKRAIKLYFDWPVPKNVPINTDGGQFGAQRDKGRRSHWGLDFAAPMGTTVMASEHGVVVYSGERAGSINGTNYGHTIVIDHAPELGADNRHIYTLYAHLDKRSAYRGREVRKGDTVGISGNSGTVAYYKKLNQSFHLHLEIIDADMGFDWGSGWPHDLHKEHRKDPKGYLGEVKTIEYDLSDLVGKECFRGLRRF